MEIGLFAEEGCAVREVFPFKNQLLKWVGNKQRFAHEIASMFPRDMKAYHEPFLGSAAVMATLAPERAFGSDSCEPLIEIWRTLQSNPEQLIGWYADRWQRMTHGNKIEVYEEVKSAYNADPNAADLLFICRTCYGGVVRFRQADGCISTPCGSHTPISPESFARRVYAWRRRLAGASFEHMDYREAMSRAGSGDVVYCDPPYKTSQAILYGAQRFRLDVLFKAIADCRRQGVFVALSIDGTKRSGRRVCDLPIPAGLFEREALVNCGRSMLKRFQMNGKSLEDHVVADRLLLTY